MTSSPPISSLAPSPPLPLWHRPHPPSSPEASHPWSSHSPHRAMPGPSQAPSRSQDPGLRPEASQAPGPSRRPFPFESFQGPCLNGPSSAPPSPLPPPIRASLLARHPTLPSPHFVLVYLSPPHIVPRPTLHPVNKGFHLKYFNYLIYLNSLNYLDNLNGGLNLNYLDYLILFHCLNYVNHLSNSDNSNNY